MELLGALAVVVIAYGLVSRRLEASSVTAPMVFVLAGILVGPDLLGIVSVDLSGGTPLLFAELTLAFVLFGDAARIGVSGLRLRRSLPARLLGIGMPLTIGAGVLVGALLLTEIEVWEAAIVAAVLAPTDAALGQSVIASPAVPRRVREALNVESGLNDGLSVPFLTLFVALAAEEAHAGAADWARFVAEQIGFGAAIGLGVGVAGGWLVTQATRRGLMTGPFRQLTMLALATLAFVLADAAGGNGFIAAFVGGFAAGRTGIANAAGQFDFLEDEGQLFSLAVFFVFGVAALGLLGAVSWHVVLYALLSLTAIRMAPVALALRGTGLPARSVAFVGWFGPRGLASIVLALTVVREAPTLPALDVVLAATTLTVLVSVVAHGLTAMPLTAAYARGADGRRERDGGSAGADGSG